MVRKPGPHGLNLGQFPGTILGSPEASVATASPTAWGPASPAAPPRLSSLPLSQVDLLGPLSSECPSRGGCPPREPALATLSSVRGQGPPGHQLVGSNQVVVTSPERASVAWSLQAQAGLHRSLGGGVPWPLPWDLVTTRACEKLGERTTASGRDGPGGLRMATGPEGSLPPSEESGATSATQATATWVRLASLPLPVHRCHGRDVSPKERRCKPNLQYRDVWR